MSYLPKNSPTFSGDPKVPTAASGDSDTSAASTAFVQAAIDSNVPKFCRLRLDTATSVANNAVTTVSNWDEVDDPFGLHSTVTNPSRITFDETGLYLIQGKVTWASSAVGVRKIYVDDQDGNQFLGTGFINGQTSAVTHQIHLLHKVNAIGDWVRMLVFQNSGAGLNMTPGYQDTFFTVIRLGAF